MKCINNVEEMEREKMALYNLWIHRAHVLENVSFALNYFIKCNFKDSSIEPKTWKDLEIFVVDFYR